jgi:phosphopantetheine adenylyltransferase
MSVLPGSEKQKQIKKEIERVQKRLGINEAVGQSIVITFGRFNPPTVGHEKLIKKVSQTNANVKEVYVSKTQDRLKNPLSSTQKIYYMKKMFPQYARMFKTISSNLILTLLTDLYKRGFREFKMVVGSDRVRKFETDIKRYNGEKNRHGFYDFSKIEIISAGERDPDAEGVTGKCE